MLGVVGGAGGSPLRNGAQDTLNIRTSGVPDVGPQRERVRFLWQTSRTYPLCKGEGELGGRRDLSERVDPSSPRG